MKCTKWPNEGCPPPSHHFFLFLCVWVPKEVKHHQKQGWMVMKYCSLVQKNPKERERRNHHHHSYYCLVQVLRREKERKYFFSRSRERMAKYGCCRERICEAEGIIFYEDVSFEAAKKKILLGSFSFLFFKKNKREAKFTQNIFFSRRKWQCQRKAHGEKFKAIHRTNR